MSNEKIITSYDMMLAKTLQAYRQGAQKGKVAIVTDAEMYIEDDGFLDVEDVFLEGVIDRHVYVYDPELGKNMWLDSNDHYSQVGDIVAYEIRDGANVMLKNFTREPKEQIVCNFEKAYKVVFGKGNGK